MSARQPRHPVECQGHQVVRIAVWDLVSGNHQGQQPRALRKQARHKTASDRRSFQLKKCLAMQETSTQDIRGERDPTSRSNSQYAGQTGFSPSEIERKLSSACAYSAKQQSTFQSFSVPDGKRSSTWLYAIVPRRSVCREINRLTSACASAERPPPGGRIIGDAITPRLARTCLRAARPMPGCCSYRISGK